jgi:hypothetical protein
VCFCGVQRGRACHRGVSLNPPPNNPLQHSSPPDQKRARVGQANEEKPVKHSTSYFGDGNIILHCQETNFRVHCTLLYMNSPVFQTLFTKHEHNTHAEYPGCIITIIDGNPEDIEVLLHRVYDGLCVFLPTHFVYNNSLLNAWLAT